MQQTVVLRIVYAGLASSGAPVSRRCVRVKQDNSQRTKCPGGGVDVMKQLKRIMGFPVAVEDESEFDGIFRVPIVTQDDGQGHGISITHGTIGEPVEAITRHDETFFVTPSDWAAAGDEFELKLEGKLKFAPDVVTSARSVGTALDSAGNQIPGAAVRISGSKLITGTACYAQLAVSYNAYTTTRQVEIPPRGEEGDEEGFYQSSMIIASECGGLEQIKVEVPQCFEDWAAAQKKLEEERKLLADVSLGWSMCGNKPLKSDPAGVYEHMQTTVGVGYDVCWEGKKCPSLPDPTDCLPDGEEEV
jgi:hypothetical protein